MQLHQHSILVTLVLSLGASFATAQVAEDSGVELKAREQWSNVFGGQQIQLHFDFTPPAAGNYTAYWSYAAGQRRLAAGELTVKAGANGDRTVELPLRIPPVNDGVIFDTMLTIKVVQDGETVASSRKPITIFPENPLANKETWLEELSISLYDPDGKTVERFKAADIPFHQMGTLASLNNVNEGILVIGEGLSLKVQRGMFDVLTEAAARGVPVLCLASAEGTFPLPYAADSELPQPERVLMDRTAVIKRFDKRYDAQAWGSGGRPAVSSLQIARSRKGVEMEVSESPAGWSWLELSFGERGVLIWCGFGVIDKWKASPTPRYLLVRIFEDLADRKQQQTVSNDKPRSLP